MTSARFPRHLQHRLRHHDSSEIVGYGNISDNAAHAMLWTSTGGMQTLNDLIPANSGWVLINANAINASGRSPATAQKAANNHAFPASACELTLNLKLGMPHSSRLVREVGHLPASRRFLFLHFLLPVIMTPATGAIG